MATTLLHRQSAAECLAASGDSLYFLYSTSLPCRSYILPSGITMYVTPSRITFTAETSLPEYPFFPFSPYTSSMAVAPSVVNSPVLVSSALRSEERRVGKEC